MKIRHIGIPVERLTEAVEYWENKGFNIISSKTERGVYIDKIHGNVAPNIELLIVKMKNQEGQCIELLKYSAPSIGKFHIALEADKMPKGIDYVITPEGHKIAYTPGPEILIELVEVKIGDDSLRKKRK